MQLHKVRTVVSVNHHISRIKLTAFTANEENGTDPRPVRYISASCGTEHSLGQARTALSRTCGLSGVFLGAPMQIVVSGRLLHVNAMHFARACSQLSGLIRPKARSVSYSHGCTSVNSAEYLRSQFNK